MTKPIIRYLRLFCETPSAEPQSHRDGIVAVAAIRESAGLARLLLCDMGQWGRNSGASLTDAMEVLRQAAHRRLIGGFHIALHDTLTVTWDGCGNFDLVMDTGDGRGLSPSPLVALDRRARPRSREAFLSWAGRCGAEMLDKAQSVGAGMWAGAEG